MTWSKKNPASVAIITSNCIAVTTEILHLQAKQPSLSLVTGSNKLYHVIMLATANTLMSLLIQSFKCVYLTTPSTAKVDGVASVTDGYISKNYWLYHADREKPKYSLVKPIPGHFGYISHMNWPGIAPRPLQWQPSS